MIYLFPFLIIFGFILSPNIKLLPGLPGIRIEDIFLILIIIREVLNHITRGKSIFANSRVLLPYLILAFFVVFSLCLQELWFGNKLIVNDVMILPMIFKYWIVALYFRSFIEKEKIIKFFPVVFLLAGLCSAFIGILQYKNLGNINFWLTPLYVERDMILTLLQTHHSGSRSVGTNGDPRHFGYMLVCAISMCFAMIIYVKLNKQRIYLCIVMGILCLALYYTLSRTSILSLLCVLTTGYLFYYFDCRKSKKRTNIALIIVLVLSSIVVFFSLQTERIGFNERLTSFKSESFNKSVHARKRDLFRPFDDALEEPIIFVFGRGPSKAHMRTSGHSDIGWIFHRFGFCGLICYLLLIVNGLRLGKNYYFQSTDNNYKVLYLCTIMVMLNWLVFSFAENIFKSPQLMTINAFFLGLVSVRRLCELSNVKKQERRYVHYFNKKSLPEGQ